MTQERRKTDRDELSKGYTQGDVGSAKCGQLSESDIHNNKKSEGAKRLKGKNLQQAGTRITARG